MRIITGTKRGCKLLFPLDENVRPTTDKVKQAIFNMIQFDIHKRVVLDLFSGTGSLGLEALSRGAEKCFFVDNYKASFEVLSKNVESTGFMDKSKLSFSSFEQFLNSTKEKFSLVFLDPPYQNGLIEKAIDLLLSKDLLLEDVIVVMETDSLEEINIDKRLTIKKQAKYGRVLITVLERN